MKTMEELTHLVSNLAREVGGFISTESSQFSMEDVELKGKSNLVSYVDKEAEKKLVAGLSDLLPGCGFITEEDTQDDLTKDYTWIIDPLDGTTNFIHGLPTYAISIALKHHQELVIGVIYEINRDELFYAWKGGGAFLNGQKIAVTPVSTVDESLFATGFPIYNFERMDQYLAILNELMKNAHGLRRVGSAATDLAYVACGRYEGFFEYNLSPWDVAAGILLVREAGGTVGDFKGGDNCLFGREIIAAGPVYSDLLKLIRKHWG